MSCSIWIQLGVSSRSSITLPLTLSQCHQDIVILFVWVILVEKAHCVARDSRDDWREVAGGDTDPPQRPYKYGQAINTGINNPSIIKNVNRMTWLLTQTKSITICWWHWEGVKGSITLLREDTPSYIQIEQDIQKRAL